MKRSEKSPAESTSSWLWLLALFTLASFTETIFWGQMSAFTPFYLPHLGIPEEDVPRWTGLIASLSGIVGLPLLPFWGALADRYSRQPVIVRSFVAHLLAGLIALLARNVWVFILGRSVMSLALGNSGLMMTTLTERVPDNRQGLAFSIMNGASPVGIFIGPLIGGPIVDHWGFPTLLAIDAGLMLAIVLLMTFGYRDTFRGRSQEPLLKMAVNSVRIILDAPRLRALFPALFFLFSGWVMAMTYIPLIVKSLYQGNDPGTAAGLVIGAGGFTAFALSPLLGWLADRYGLWRTVIAGACLEVILWLTPLAVTGLTGIGVAWAMINGVASSVFAISFSLLARSAPAQVRGRVMSFSYLPVNIGSVIGPAIGSAITHNSLFSIFPAAALLTSAGIALLFVARGRAVTAVKAEY